MAWTVDVSRHGKYTLTTENKYVDRNIEINVPAGSVTLEGKAITANPTVTWDATNKKIKATYSGSDTVGANITSGWVDDVDGVTVTTSGETNVDPTTLDANLVATNIKTGTSILGVEGSLKGSDFGTTTVTRDGNVTSWGTGWIEEGSSTGDVTSMQKGNGSVSLTANGIEVGEALNSAPSGSYLKVEGSGVVNVESNGWIEARTQTSNTDTKYYAIAEASFSNTATDGKTYVDGSESAPVLISDSFLFINKGMVLNDTKISLSKLVPDDVTLTASTGAPYIREGQSAWDKDGKKVIGTMGMGELSATASAEATISELTYTLNGSTGKYDITGTKELTGTTTANVSKLGYVDNTVSATANVSGSATVAASVNASAISGALVEDGTKTAGFSNYKVETTAGYNPSALTVNIPVYQGEFTIA